MIDCQHVTSKKLHLYMTTFQKDMYHQFYYSAVAYILVLFQTKSKHSILVSQLSGIKDVMFAKKTCCGIFVCAVFVLHIYHI